MKDGAPAIRTQARADGTAETRPSVGGGPRVAFLIRYLQPGGIQQMRLILARALADRGVRPEIVVGRADGPLRAEIPTHVPLVVLDRSDAATARWTALRSDPAGAAAMARPVLFPLATSWQVRNLPALIRYLRVSPPDVLITSAPYLDLIALWARRVTGAPTAVAVTEHMNLSQYLFAGRKRRKWHYRHLLPLLRRVYPSADAFIAVSDGVGDDLSATVGLPRDRIETIYNPVVTPGLAAKAAAPVDHPWFRPGEPPVVLAAGRLHEQKDFATLLRAFARVCTETPARLVILGEGGSRPTLEALAADLGIAERVDMPGFSPNPFAYMARASVFVLSSTSEGLGNVLIEAMACGCPVVSTDCPDGPSEILAGGRYGRLVPVGDDRALGAAIVDVLRKSPDPETAIARAREFSVDRAADRYVNLIERLLMRADRE